MRSRKRQNMADGIFCT